MASGTAADASVRPARAADAPAVAAVQAAAWRAAYAELLGAEALAQLTPANLEGPWREAISSPPSRKHAVLVALTGELVVGFAAVAPSEDRDAAPRDGELVALWVDPLHQRQGHASRLLSAAAESLRSAGLTGVAAWTPEPDSARRAFLASAGLLPDGARRTLDTGQEGGLTEIRYTALLGEEPTGREGATSVEPVPVEPVEIEIHRRDD